MHRTGHPKFLAALLAGAALSLLAAAPALAASKFTDLKKEPAIRSKVELSKGRFEISPFLGVSILDGSFNRLLVVGAHLKYHLTPWLDIGGHISGTAVKIKTTIHNDICTVRESLSMPCDDGTNPDSFPGRTRAANFQAFLQASLTPMYGKVSLFGALFLRYEFALFGGFGVVGTNNLAGTASALRPSPTFGTDIHLYFTEFFALDIQFRDTVVLDNWYGVTNASGDLDLKANHLAMFTFGATIMLPFKAKRTK
jgi:hypothetical protein